MSAPLLLLLGGAAVLLLGGKKKSRSGTSSQSGVLDSGALPDGTKWRIVKGERFIHVAMKGPNSQEFTTLSQGSVTVFYNEVDARAFIAKLESGEMLYNPESGLVLGSRR